MSNVVMRIMVTTFPDRAVAEEVTRLLLDPRLAVCGKVGAHIVYY